MPILPEPDLPFANPFLFRIHLVEKEVMRQHMIYHFGLNFASAVMAMREPVVYPITVYGRDWACSIFILY
jgi:hypothetical protein